MKLLTKFVVYCVVYCLTIKIAHQFGFGGFEESRLSINIWPEGSLLNDHSAHNRVKRFALSKLNHTRSPKSNKTRRTKSTPLDFFKHKILLKSIVDHVLLPNFTTPTWEQLRPSLSSLQDFPPDSHQLELSQKQFKKLFIRMFFEKYHFHPKYDQFYDWFYDVLRQPHRLERRWRAFRNFTGTFDYENLLSSTPYSIPTAYGKFYAGINEIERIYKIRPEDPPSLDSDLFDSGYTPTPSASTKRQEEIRKLNQMFFTDRTHSWEDSEEKYQKQCEFHIPEGIPEKYRPFHKWLASVYVRLTRKKKKDNAFVNLEHINVFSTHDYATEFNNTPFPIPDDCKALYPYFKRFDLAYEGVLKRHNDTHYTIITTESTPRTTKSTPIAPWKKGWLANPINSTVYTIPPHLTHLLNITWKFTPRKSGRNYTLITMPWDDKVSAYLRVFFTQKLAWQPKTTPMQFDPKYKKYLEWEKEALFKVGENVAKIDFGQDTTYCTRAEELLPFSVPPKRRQFYEMINNYLEQINNFTSTNQPNSRWPSQN